MEDVGHAFDGSGLQPLANLDGRLLQIDRDMAYFLWILEQSRSEEPSLVVVTVKK